MSLRCVADCGTNVNVCTGGCHLCIGAAIYEHYF
jgi:hypothetical protein